jgi:repeat uncharacterized protein DUF347
VRAGLSLVSGLEPLIRTPSALKVPARIALLFWAWKLLTTAFGESTSDYLVHSVNPYLAVMAGFVVFVVAMALQLRTDRYVPWVYWLAVAMVAVFGTASRRFGGSCSTGRPCWPRSRWGRRLATSSPTRCDSASSPPGFSSRFCSPSRESRSSASGSTRSSPPAPRT